MALSDIWKGTIMTDQTAMPINDFCPLGYEIKTTDINGATWIVFDNELCDALEYPDILCELLPYDEKQVTMFENQPTTFISERLFYQIVLGSTATKAIEFRNWAATSLLWRWYETTGDPQDIYNAERLRFAPRSVMGAIEVIVSENLPISRQQQIS